MRLLALVDAPDHVCCRYRIRAFAPALTRAGWSLDCWPWKRSLLARVAQLSSVSSYDAVIMQRRLLPGWQLAILRKHARHLVFDFDDAVLFRDSFARRGTESRVRQKRFESTVQAADVVIAGNDFLADCALRSGAPAARVRMIPTCVDPELYPQRAVAERPRGASRGCDLVWIGSSSTLRGLEQQHSLWDRLGREIPGLRLRVICDRFPDFGALPIVPVPWSQAWEARDLAAGQIGVSWLPEDSWSQGKCGLKVLQYQAAGLPVVANPFGMHVELVEPGQTGFLPRAVDDWIEAIRTLCGDPALRQAMGQTARSRVQAGYSTEAWASAFVDSVSAVEPAVPQEPAPLGRAASRAIPDPFFLRSRRSGGFHRVVSRAWSGGERDDT